MRISVPNIIMTCILHIPQQPVLKIHWKESHLCMSRHNIELDRFREIAITNCLDNSFINITAPWTIGIINHMSPYSFPIRQDSILPKKPEKYSCPLRCLSLPNHLPNLREVTSLTQEEIHVSFSHEISILFHPFPS